MKDLTKAVLLLLTGLIGLSTNLLSQDVEGLKTFLVEMNNEIEQAVINDDPESTMNYYAEDVIYMPSYMPMIKGLDEIRKQDEMNKDKQFNFTAFELTIEEVFASGEYAYVVGKYTYSMEMPQMPEPFNDEGKYVYVLASQDDDTWKIKAEIWNSDLNPWMMMNGMKEKKFLYLICLRLELEIQCKIVSSMKLFQKLEIS